MKLHLSSIKQVLHWHIWLLIEIVWRSPTWNRSALEKMISSWKLMTSPFSSWIHPFPMKNCLIYNSTVLFGQSSKHLMPICAVDNFWGELNIAAPMFAWPRPATIFKKSNFSYGACLKISQWNLACLLHKYSETNMPNFSGNITFLQVHWPLEVYGNSLCRHLAPVCPAMDKIGYNSTRNPWQNEKILEMHQQKNCLKICSFTAIDHHNSALSMMHRCA